MSVFPHVLCFSFGSNLGIRIGTIVIAAKIHQVITAKGQTAVPLRRNIPRTVISCPTDWLPYAMKIPYKVSQLSGTD